VTAGVVVMAGAAVLLGAFKSSSFFYTTAVLPALSLTGNTLGMISTFGFSSKVTSVPGFWVPSFLIF